MPPAHPPLVAQCRPGSRCAGSVGVGGAGTVGGPTCPSLGLDGGGGEVGRGEVGGWGSKGTGCSVVYMGRRVASRSIVLDRRLAAHLPWCLKNIELRIRLAEAVLITWRQDSVTLDTQGTLSMLLLRIVLSRLYNGADLTLSTLARTTLAKENTETRPRSSRDSSSIGLILAGK